jgi:hypothetical protein
MPVLSVNDREVEITLNGERVELLIGEDNSETFDLPTAVEAVLELGEIVDIKEGDVLVMTVHV